MPGLEMVSFPPFHLDRSGQLRCGEEERFLRPKTLAVLHHLVTHAGQMVSKDELLTAAWPEVTVSEAVLVVCVNELRQALGDDPRQPHFIETVHRRGYRFIASLTAAAPPVQSPESKVQSPKISLVSIVVGREADLAQLQQ